MCDLIPTNWSRSTHYCLYLKRTAALEWPFMTLLPEWPLSAVNAEKSGDNHAKAAKLLDSAGRKKRIQSAGYAASNIGLRTRWSGVRTEERGARRQAEPRSGDVAAKLPSNLSGRATKSTSYRPVQG